MFVREKVRVCVDNFCTYFLLRERDNRHFIPYKDDNNSNNKNNDHADDDTGICGRTKAKKKHSDVKNHQNYQMGMVCMNPLPQKCRLYMTNFSKN
jgi:hypothetical protein